MCSRTWQYAGLAASLGFVWTALVDLYGPLHYRTRTSNAYPLTLCDYLILLVKWLALSRGPKCPGVTSTTLFQGNAGHSEDLARAGWPDKTQATHLAPRLQQNMGWFPKNHGTFKGAYRDYIGGMEKKMETTI